jgi:hypothetical protein
MEMKNTLIVFSIASILILGTLGFSQNVMADHNGSHTEPCDENDTVGGGALGNSPGPASPALGWDVGSGQCNGSFSSVTDPAFDGGELELALRAEERRIGQVDLTGINDYTVLTGNDANAPSATNRAWWNFQGSIAYDGDIDTLDSLTLTIRTDAGPNIPTAPPVDLLAIRGLIDDRLTPSTSGFSDLYQISQSPEFGWFSVAPDMDANPTGAFDYSKEGAWFFTLTAVKGQSTSSVSICIHTPNESCDIPVVGGISIPIDQTALLLAGVQSVSMWMIPVVLAGIGIGVFVIKRRN